MLRLSIVMLLCAGCDSGSPPGGPGDPMTPGSTVELNSPEFTLQPGEELFKCWYTSLPADKEIAATRIRSKMSAGSHHFIVYTTEKPLRPDGTLEDCGNGFGGGGMTAIPVWLYASQDPENKLEMPSGVAMTLAAHQPIYFDMHYINSTPNPIHVKVQLSLDLATGSYQRAGAFVTFNTQIQIPPGGKQTVQGDCRIPAGAQFFMMSTHSHKRTTEALAARFMNGQMGEVLVRTTDWEHATQVNWQAPFLTFPTGERLHYRCDYDNPTSNTITVGESAELNEMCMAVGYYFPATSQTFCLNSFTFER